MLPDGEYPSKESRELLFVVHLPLAEGREGSGAKWEDWGGAGI